MTTEAYEKIREGLQEALDSLRSRFSESQLDLLRALEAHGPGATVYLIARDRRVAGPLRTKGLVEIVWEDKRKMYALTEFGRTYLRTIE